MKTMKAALAFLITLAVATSVQAGAPPEYTRYFDPAKGFKPAQRNLTEAYLQAAASLEHFGSPEPYLRHMLAEHDRIHKLAMKAVGQNARSCRPTSMTDEHVEKLIANWNKLSPVLHLDAVAREIGEDVRNGIRGVLDKGTIAITLLNEHQKQVLDNMSSSKERGLGFLQLQAKLITELELDKPSIDTRGYEITRRDAVSYADLARATMIELRSKLTKTLPAEKADQIADAIQNVFISLAELVHSEFEAGIQEWSLQ